ncbi:aminodeoxychorismate lyase [Staphylococcus chromogenes]|uniref:aminotransferase class IV n=1 Tax=Staphylococcus chromogenes TaxID=46126 RepID=UPI000D1A0E72|nr:aminotransferase class IV [Staphylococcus chromogenes]PTG06134.1 aminodeoxychorismate lyase [Staphylococcus chromogenes]PTG16583.1 aminodeoxychorismate lyase [Staphylococcus chromogenes]
MELFETMRLEEGTFKRETYHFQRLKRASEAFQFNFNDLKWSELMTEISTLLPTGTHRIKIRLKKEGTFQFEHAPLPPTEQMTAGLQQICSNTPPWQRIYKTTERDYLKHTHETQLILLYDTNDKILEFDIGNVVVEYEGRFYTPPYEKDFLKGCMRQSLLDQQQLITKHMTLATMRQFLNQGGKLWMINSLRGWVPVKLINV